jgi:hypothetical protein
MELQNLKDHFEELGLDVEIVLVLKHILNKQWEDVGRIHLAEDRAHCEFLRTR